MTPIHKLGNFIKRYRGFGIVLPTYKYSPKYKYPLIKGQAPLRDYPAFTTEMIGISQILFLD